MSNRSTSLRSRQYKQPYTSQSSHRFNGKLSSSFFSRFRGIFLILGFALFCAFLFFFVLLPQLFVFKSDENVVIIPSSSDVNKGKIYFAHISASSRKIDVFLLPEDEQVEVIGGYGRYPLRAVYPLLQSEKKDTNFIRSTYGFALHRVVDQVWVEKKPLELFSNDSFSSVTKTLFVNSLESPLNLNEKIQLYEFTQSLRPNQMTFSILKNIDELTHSSEKIAFPSQASDCSVAVINTTSVSGLGTKIGDSVEQSGFSLVRVTTNPDASYQDISTIIYSGPEGTCSQVIQHIQHLFPQSVSLKNDEQAFTTYRSHITIFLAKDLGNVFLQTQKAFK